MLTTGNLVGDQIFHRSVVRAHWRPVHVPRPASGENALGLAQVRRKQCTSRAPPHWLHPAPDPHHLLGASAHAGSPHGQDLSKHVHASDDRG